MSEYDVITDDVTKTCFNFFKSHTEGHWKGLDLRSKMPKTVLCYDFYFSSYGKLNIFLLSPGICFTILSFYKVNVWFIFYRFFLGRVII